MKDRPPGEAADSNESLLGALTLFARALSLVASTHGMEPSTAADLTKVCKFSGKQVAEAVKSMSKCDAAMVNALRTRCTALMAERNIQQDKRARYNYGMRLVKEDARGTTDFKTVDDGLVLAWRQGQLRRKQVLSAG